MRKVFVYALFNKINTEIYVGIAFDPVTRLNEHNRGKNRYTKAFRPWNIFFTEEHKNFAEARAKEKYYKSAAGKRYLKKILDYS